MTPDQSTSMPSMRNEIKVTFANKVDLNCAAPWVLLIVVVAGVSSQNSLLQQKACKGKVDILDLRSDLNENKE